MLGHASSDHQTYPILDNKIIFTTKWRTCWAQVWESQVNCTWPMNVTNLFVRPRNNALPVTDNTSHRVTSNAHTCDVGRDSVTPECVVNIIPTWSNGGHWGHKLYLNSIGKSLSDDLEKVNSDPSVPHTKHSYDVRILRFKSASLAHGFLDN